MDCLDTIYTALKLNHSVVLSVFDALVKVKGLNCTVTVPTQEKTIFGLEDVVDYDERTTYDAKLLCFNIFKEGTKGMYEFDSFINDTFILTRYADKLPLQTKVIINFMGRKLSMKVDDHNNLYPSTTEQVLIKNMLVPLT